MRGSNLISFVILCVRAALGQTIETELGLETFSKSVD